jgi:hypothetical protein
MTDEIINPTFGYRKGEARIFNLKPGEALPDGWSPTMPRGEHPHDLDGTNAKDELPVVPTKPRKGE